MASSSRYKTAAELRALAVQSVVQNGRINELVNNALGYIEQDSLPKGLAEAAYMDYCRSHTLLFHVIPNHEDYESFAAKKSAFRDSYGELQKIVSAQDYVPALEAYLDARAASDRPAEFRWEEFRWTKSGDEPKPTRESRHEPREPHRHDKSAVNGRRIPRKPVVNEAGAGAGGKHHSPTDSRVSLSRQLPSGRRSESPSGSIPIDPLAARFEKLRLGRQAPVLAEDTDPSSRSQSPPALPTPLSASPRSTPAPLDPRFRIPPSQPPPAPPTSSFPAKTTSAAADSAGITFPKTTAISGDILVKYLKHVPESILVIDVRPRAQFEEAHIAAPNIVCIEPVSLRKSMNDEALEDTFVMAPDTEYQTFAQRSSYELVVYYDNESRSNSYRGGPAPDSESITLYYLTSALYDYAFSRPLKRPPCLLVGGFDDWLDAFQGKYVSGSAGTSGSALPPSLPSPTPPQEIPSRPYGSRKGSLVSTPSYVRDVNDYLRSTGSGSNSNGAVSLSNGTSNGRSYSQSSIQGYNNSYQGLGQNYVQSYSPPNQAPKAPAPVEPPYHQPQTSPPKHQAPPPPLYASYPTPPQQQPPQHHHLQHYHQPYQSSYGSHSVVAAPSKPHPVVYPQYPVVEPPPSGLPPNLPVQQYAPQVTTKPPSGIVEFTTGLKNLGNTCYMNCIIQCLSGTPALASAFADGSYRQHININSRLGYRGVLAQRFGELVQTMQRQDVQFVGPLALKDLSGKLREQFQGYEQQDCQEFLTFILDGLHEDLNSNGDKERLKELTEEEERRREGMSVRVASTIEWERYLKSDFSLVVDTFQGQYQSRLRCLTCGNTSTTYNPFSFLSLPIPLNRPRVSLEDCFDLFTAEEVLDGDDAWHCPKCKTARRTLKVLRISRLPPVLIVHLKRFQQRRGGQISDKLETPVSYPVRGLDLTRYWPDYADGDEQKLARLPLRGQTAPFKYDLYAVANHFGTLKGGHYTSFVHKGRKGWCYFDDTRVQRALPDENVVSRHAYVLFYERKMGLH